MVDRAAVGRWCESKILSTYAHGTEGGGREGGSPTWPLVRPARAAGGRGGLRD